MPELPDVEVWRRHLHSHIVGDKVTRAEVHDLTLVEGSSLRLEEPGRSNSTYLSHFWELKAESVVPVMCLISLAPSGAPFTSSSSPSCSSYWPQSRPKPSLWQAALNLLCTVTPM